MELLKRRASAWETYFTNHVQIGTAFGLSVREVSNSPSLPLCHHFPEILRIRKRFRGFASKLEELLNGIDTSGFSGRSMKKSRPLRHFVIRRIELIL